MKIIGYILLIAILFCQDVSLKPHRELAKSLDSVGSNRIQAYSPYLSYKLQQRPSRNVANARGQEGTVKYLLKHRVEQTHYDLVDPLFLLQNLVMLQTRYTAQELLDDDEKLTAASNAVFDQVDYDHSGLINLEELTKAMRSAAVQNGIPSPTDEQVKSMFDELDTTNDGYVDKPEFKAFVRDMIEFLMS